MKSYSQAGYTLIEILIVLFIISIVTSVALISISHNENRQLETFTNELVQVMSLAEEQAMLQPAVLGVSMNNGYLQLQRLQETNSKNVSWVPLQDTVYDKKMIPGNIQVKVSVQGVAEAKDKQEKAPQIIISTNGDITPFTIDIGKPGSAPRYRVTGDADGNITSTQLS
jgi:general secretion pathway protein H